MRSGCLSVLWIALLLALSAAPAGANVLDPLAVDFFFDVAVDDLAAARGAPGDDADTASEILIGGIPLRVRGQEVDGGWRTVAGANGRYAMPLGNGLTVIGRARVATTDFVDHAALDKAVASGAAELRYTRDGWTLGLQPGLEITRWGSALVQRDSTIEARVSRTLGGGLSIATTGRYRWRQTAGAQTVNGEIAFGRAGLVYRLPHRARLDMAYVVRHEVANVGVRPIAIHSTGPAVALALPLGEAIDLSLKYDFTETSRYDAAATTGEQMQDLHQLGLALNWDLGGDSCDAELSTAYKYGHLSATATGRDEARHNATVSLALDF